jgi:hypothetical protein
MITGAHSIIYSTNPDADRAFLRDVLKLTNVMGKVSATELHSCFLDELKTFSQAR